MNYRIDLLSALLRSDADRIDRGGGTYEALIPGHMREAADELERLSKECAELKERITLSAYNTNRAGLAKIRQDK